MKYFAFGVFQTKVMSGYNDFSSRFFYLKNELDIGVARHGDIERIKFIKKVFCIEVSLS